jgi:uncharacterized protein YbjT (DUF2867 family)
MSSTSALLVGASGLVGRHLLQLLLHESVYERIAVLVRKPLAVSHTRLTQHVVDFDRLDHHKKIIRADDVFCCLGTTIRAAGSQEAFRKVDFTYVVQTAALASKNGARQFLMVSSLGANVGSKIFYSRAKGKVEEAVSKLPFFGIHIFRPSILLGERAESRPGEKAGIAVMKLFSFAMIGPWKKYKPIHAQIVANAMVRVASAGLQGVNIFESVRIQTLGSSQDKHLDTSH